MNTFRSRLLSNLMRVFFHLLYHPFAWTYDWVATVVSVGMWQDWVLSILPSLEGPRVLELGHAPGHLQSALLEGGIQAFGLDRSPQMGRLARKRLLKQKLSPALVNGAAQNLPFAREYFQQVVATFPTEYIADPHTLAEIYRVLMPGGEAVILPIAWITGKRPFERGAAWLFRVTGEAPRWDDKAIARALEPARQAGFEVWSERRTLKSSLLLVIHARKSG